MELAETYRCPNNYAGSIKLTTGNSYASPK